MWYAIIGSLAASFLAGTVYISFRAANFQFVKRAARGKRWLARLICLVFFALVFLALYAWIGVMNALVCMVHLTVFWLISDLVALIYRKAARRERGKYYAGGVAVVLCVLYLGAGWYAAHHVSVTEYTFTTEKKCGEIKIVQITDSHVGATFDADGFLKYIEEINGLNPDVLVVTGDFVDDNTSREDMLGACIYSVN